jgi:hypothetical protein
MKLAMKLATNPMLMDLLTLMEAHELTRQAALRSARAAPRRLGALVSRLGTWRPDAFAVWPRQREW